MRRTSQPGSRPIVAAPSRWNVCRTPSSSTVRRARWDAVSSTGESALVTGQILSGRGIPSSSRRGAAGRASPPGARTKATSPTFVPVGPGAKASPRAAKKGPESLRVESPLGVEAERGRAGEGRVVDEGPGGVGGVVDAVRPGDEKMRALHPVDVEGGGERQLPVSPAAPCSLHGDGRLPAEQRHEAPLGNPGAADEVSGAGARPPRAGGRRNGPPRRGARGGRGRRPRAGAPRAAPPRGRSGCRRGGRSSAGRRPAGRSRRARRERYWRTGGGTSDRIR